MSKTQNSRLRDRGVAGSTKDEERRETREERTRHEETDMLAGVPGQPSWVAVLQASINDMQLKLGERIEESLRGVREEVSQLKEEMGKLGTEMKRGMEDLREETRGKFEAGCGAACSTERH